MNRNLIVAVLALGAIGSAHGQTASDPPMRELIVQSKVVVLAAPIGPMSAGRFKVNRVLLGTALKERDEFKAEELSKYDLTVPAAENSSARKAADVVQALLFLNYTKTDAVHFWVTPSGLRIQTADGVYYTGSQQHTDGYTFFPYHWDIRWEDVVRSAEVGAQEIRHLRSLGEIEDPRRRNKALLDWVERHRTEFGAGRFMDKDREPSCGWGSLEQDVFQWIFESRVPEDCWAAVQVHVELNRGGLPCLPCGPVGMWAFSTRAGRSFLLKVASDDGLLIGPRVRALELLCEKDTVWPLRVEGAPDVEKPDETEQAELIDRAIPLLKDASNAVRAAVADVLVAASMPGGAALESRCIQRPLPALISAYKRQPPGETRDRLADAAHYIGGRKAWEEATGNGHGVMAVFRAAAGANDDYLIGDFVTTPETNDDGSSFDAPKLLLERLDEKGLVLETKELPPDKLYIAEPVGPINGIGLGLGGPAAGGPVPVRFSIEGYAPGVWRMTAKGYAGADKAPWTSEPRLLRLNPPPQPGQPSLAPRIVFDP